jgi:adenine-specific DNA-methyltransferase
MNVNADQLSALDFMDRDDLLKMVKSIMGGGITLSFHGKRTAQEIGKKG